ncbi:hypothetical protein Tco_0213411 [Tanacetum coccineum]
MQTKTEQTPEQTQQGVSDEVLKKVNVVNGILASGVDMVLEKDLVGFALQEMKIHPLLLLTLSMIIQTFSPTLHNPSTRHTRANYVEMILTIVMIDDDDYEESTIPLNEIVSQIPPSIAITPVLPTLEPEDSLIIGDENLSTIPEKELDEVINSSVEDLVPIPREFEDTSGSDSECDLPSCDDFSPISEEKSVIFSNPLFDSNDDFTSSDDESLSDKDVPEDNVKIYSNPLFEFDDEYISSDVNPLFDEVLENIESKDSYVSNLDEPAFLVTPLYDANKDECFDPGGEFDEIEACLTSDSIPSGIDELHFDGLNIPPDSEEFLDRDPRSLEDEPDKDDLKNIVKVFDPGIQ